MNIIELLHENGIRTWDKGENVRHGWISIRCPYCSDTFNHLSINPKTLFCKCWICGVKNIYGVLSNVTNLSRSEIRSYVKSLSPVEGVYNHPPERRLSHQTLLPPESTKVFPKGHLNYLIKDRGLGEKRTKRIIRKYNLFAVHTEGKYRFRIIIPVYMNHKLIAYTSRAITEEQSPKYLTCEYKEFSFDPFSTIYNYDSILPGENAIAVEGPADVWSMGDRSFATLGVGIRAGQISMLIKKKINKLFVFFDNDKPGKMRSYHFARNMKPICKKVERICFEDCKKTDPGELTETEVERIKRDIGFYEEN